MPCDAYHLFSRSLIGLCLALLASSAEAQVTKILGTDDLRGIGRQVVGMGDLDKDGYADIAASVNRRIEILFLHADSTIKRHERLVTFTGSQSNLGDLNGDGTIELAIGDGGNSRHGELVGSVRIASVNTDGTLQGLVEISRNSGGLGDGLAPFTQFGTGIAFLADLNGDGLHELAVSAVQGQPDGNPKLWLLSLNPDGTVHHILRSLKEDEFPDYIVDGGNS